MDLKTVDWHDLPLVSLAITDNAVVLVVTPYDEATSGYLSYKLTITGFAELRLNIQSMVSSQDLANLEVASFDWKAEPDNRISGSIGILSANQGYWTVGFVNARHTVTRMG